MDRISKAQALKYKKKLLMKTPDVEVWLVNGKKVRDNLSIEFVEGAHDHVHFYSSLQGGKIKTGPVPKGEIWIDDALHKREIPKVIIHEMYERELMKDGLPYSEAHDRANLVELRVRRKPETTNKALMKHVAKSYFCRRCKDYHTMKDKLYEKHVRYNHNN